MCAPPDDGSYVWHYQTTPGESWDYTATQHIVIADLTIDGAARRVVMQAPKNGFFYVLDAATGKLISADKFAAVNWATGVDLTTGRPIENPAAKRPAWRVDGPSAGMLATAGGLVFHGVGDRLVARGATDGGELWRSPSANTGIVAAPISFELDGVQHVAVVAGRATGNYYAPVYSRLLVFRRGANVELPPATPFTPAPLSPPPSVASAEQIARGRTLYDANCVLCHDDPGNAGGIFLRGLFPDLAYSPTLPSAHHSPFQVFAADSISAFSKPSLGSPGTVKKRHASAPVAASYAET